MKTEDLVKVWNAPDNSKLTPKQMSIRLPIYVSASISALAEMFPRKTKTEIIGDLLRTAIDELEKGLTDESEEEDQHGELILVPFGDRTNFRDLRDKYLKELEIELDKSNKE